jgi:accessory gene regulator B
LVQLGSVDEENRDIYEYGLRMTASLVGNLAITVALGFIFGAPLELLAMFLPFIALRSVSGGYHAESFAGCVITSAISIAAAIISIKLIPERACFLASIVLSLFVLTVTFAFAPVEHPNRPIDDTEIAKFRKLARIIAMVAVVLTQLLFLLHLPRYGFSVSLGITLSGTATLLSFITKKKGEKHDEEVV